MLQNGAEGWGILQKDYGEQWGMMENIEEWWGIVWHRWGMGGNSGECWGRMWEW